MGGLRELFLLVISLCLLLNCFDCLPTVDPGVFVLQGVRTCRDGRGYCLLGRSCTIDKDFAPDDQQGHCKDLAKSFTSKLPFTCCKYVNDTSEREDVYETTISTFTLMDEKFQILDQNPISLENIHDTSIPEDEDPSNLIDIIGVVTDTTGIIELVTRPYQPPSIPSSTTDYQGITNDSVTPTTPKPTTNEDEENKMGAGYTKHDEIKHSTDKKVSNEHSSENELKVLNLPEEIRKYLSKQQSKAKPNETVQTISSSNDSNDTEESTTVNSFNNNYINKEEKKEEGTTTDFLIKSTTPFTFTTELMMIRREIPSHLKGNPLVPLIQKENKHSNVDEKLHSSTSESGKMVTEAFTSTLTEPQETGITDSPNLKSTLLQRLGEYAGGDTIEEIILPYSVNLNICGLRRSNLMISENAQTASTYDFCWSAALMNKERGRGKFECSGALVELDLVMTTAACLKRLRNKNLSSYRVVLGDSNLKDELPYGVQYRDIEEIVTHPDYLTSGGAHANDIGLIRLRDLATLDHNVCLACLSQLNAYIPGHSCVVSGYTLGDIPKDIRRDVEGFSPVEGMLRESPVVLEKPSECQSSVRKMVSNPLLVIYPDAFLCDVKEKSASSCANTLDGGSPLVCEVGGRWFLTGISSWSRDCSLDPNIYTKVSSFSDWYLNMRLRLYGFVTHKV